MAVNERIYEVYRELADWHDRQGQPQLRDRFLVLAADAALALDLEDEAERLRSRLLHANPHHMLKPFASFAQAMRSPDVQSYVGNLRDNYPLETAEALLESLRKSLPKGDTEMRGLPPTMPVVDLSRPTEPAPGSSEPLKVFRLRDEPEEPVPTLPAWQEPPDRPAPPRKAVPPVPARPAPRKPPVPPPRPAPPPVSRAARPQPAPKAPSAPVEPEEVSGGWVATGLFLLLLLMGLALTGYTLAWPFLPPL